MSLRLYPSSLRFAARALTRILLVGWASAAVTAQAEVRSTGDLNIFPVFTLNADRAVVKIRLQNANHDAVLCTSIDTLARFQTENVQLENRIELRRAIVWPGETAVFMAGEDTLKLIREDFPAATIGSLSDPHTSCRPLGFQHLKSILADGAGGFIGLPDHTGFWVRPIERGLQLDMPDRILVMMHNGMTLSIPTHPLPAAEPAPLIYPNDPAIAAIANGLKATIAAGNLSARDLDLRTSVLDVLAAFTELEHRGVGSEVRQPDEAPRIYTSPVYTGLLTFLKMHVGEEKFVDAAPSSNAASESALLNGQQSLALTTRPPSPTARSRAKFARQTISDHIVAYAAPYFTMQQDAAVTQLTRDEIRAIFTCQVTTWEQLSGQHATGPIATYATEQGGLVLAAILGLDRLGSCVAIQPFDQVRLKTGQTAGAVGCGDETIVGEGNRTLAIGDDKMSLAILPLYRTVRDQSYPLILSLHVLTITNGFHPHGPEEWLVEHILDPSYVDPLLGDFHLVVPEEPDPDTRQRSNSKPTTQHAARP